MRQDTDIDRIMAMVQDEDSAIDELRVHVANMDISRDVYLYARQSKVSVNSANYRQAQDRISERLVEAGVPAEQLVVLTYDDNKSATLNEKYRQDYKRLIDAIKNDMCGTVVCIEISRLHRDVAGVQEAIMARDMGWRNVCVLTQTESQKWLWLDMSAKEAQKTYCDIAAKAASEWGRMRSRSMTSRLNGLRNHQASTGGTIAMGWRLIPGQKKAVSDNGEYQPPLITIYKPHALVKLRVMRESLLPHIKNLGDLRRHLIGLGITVPPFDASLPPRVFNRSCMRNICLKIGSVRIYHTRTDTITEMGRTFLTSMLIEPQILGDVRYGSGVGGHYALIKHKQIADSMQQQAFSKITGGRVYAYTDRALALCRPENYEAMSEAEQAEWAEFPTFEALESFYAQVVTKWCAKDMMAARAAQYKHYPPNTIRKNSPSVGRPAGRTSPWAGKVFCGNHGWHDEDWGDSPHAATNIIFPNLIEKFSLGQGIATRKEPNFRNEQWTCIANQKREGTRGSSCQTWASTMLTQILDTHTKRQLHKITSGNEQIFADIFAQKQQAKQDTARIKSDIERLEIEKQRGMDKYDRYDRMLSTSAESERNITLDGIIRDDVQPYVTKIAELKADLLTAARAGNDTDLAATETELKSALAKAYEEYDNLDGDKKRHLISLLVDSVVVMTGDGVTSEESLIFFRWRDMSVDVLVGWRTSTQDSRPWTAEEDAAIHELWTSQCHFSELYARVQSGRKYYALKRRAIAIGATGSKGRFRKVTLKTQADEMEMNWIKANPDVLYLELLRYELGKVQDCHIIKKGQIGYPDASPRQRMGVFVPINVKAGIQQTLSRYLPADFVVNQNSWGNDDGGGNGDAGSEDDGANKEHLSIINSSSIQKIKS